PTFTTLTLSTIAAEDSDVDKFLVDSSGLIKYRTGIQVLSDIGASASGHNHSGVYQPLDVELTSLALLSYAAASFVKMTGVNTFALRTLQETSDDLEATIDHDNLFNFTSDEHFLQSAITEVGTIATGVWEGTDVGVSHGGTGQSTALAGFDALCPTGTKGDLAVYGGSSASVALGVGTNDQVLTADSNEASGIKWADAAGGGGYNPVPVCTSYGTEAILSSGSNDEITGSNQACDWVWLANQDNYKYLLIAG
ncbi:unnamed protein product, partial [marine sediment metagenome]